MTTLATSTNSFKAKPFVIRALYLCFAISFFGLNDSFGQAVSINSTGTAPDAQSILDISSTTKGILLPRMTTAQRTAISPTATSDFGMTVYDLTTSSYWYWDGAAWQEIPNMGNIPAVTLDAAYDGGGSGAGRIIVADNGAVDIQGTGGLLVSGQTAINTTPQTNFKLSILANSGTQGIYVLSSGGSGGTYGIHSTTATLNYTPIFGENTSTSTASAYSAIRGSISTPSATNGYLGYHTTGNNSYAVYGTGGTYAGYFDGHVNFNGDIRLNGSAGTAGQVLVSQGTGVDPIWGAAGVQSVTAGAALVNSGTATAPILDAAADNGLNVDVAADKIQLGGALTEATVITHGANDLTHTLSGAGGLIVNLASTGDFVVQDGGTPHFEINDNDGNAFFGGDVTLGDGSTAGTVLMDFTDAGTGGDDGRIQIYNNGVVNHVIHGDGDVIFNELGNDRNFKIESLTEPNMFFLDAGLDRIGVGIGTPTQTLDVDGSIRMRAGTTTAGWVPVSSGDGTMVWTDPTLLGSDVTTASNGLTEVTNDIRLGGSLTQNTVVAQAAFTLDFTSTAVDGFSIDGTTFSVDAANNRIGIGTAAPTTPLHISSTADDVVRVQGADHSRLLVDGTDASEKSIGFSEAAVIQWRAGMDDSNGAGGNANDFSVKQVNDASPEFVIQASSGNVGIGTNSPDAMLNVGDAAGASIYLTREDNSTAANDVLGSILFDSTDDTAPSTTDASAGIRAYASVDHGNSNKGAYLTFFTKNNILGTSLATEQMRITAAGNVGIGVATPDAKLEVVGNVRISGLAAGGNVQANTSGDLIISNDIPGGDASYVQNQYTAQQASSEYWISGRGRMDGGITVGAGGTIDNNNINSGTIATGALAFGNASGEGIGSKRNAGGNQYGLDFYTNSINRLAITSAGNVGIGTSAADALLHIADFGASGAKNLLIGDDAFFTDIDVANFLGLYGNANADRVGLRLGSDGGYIFGDGGHIGIGTTSPNASLNIIHQTSNTTPTAPSGYWAALVENRQDANDGRHGLSVVTRWGSNTSKVFEAATYWNGSETYTPILTVTGDQRVGIGTTSPSSKLHVSGVGSSSTNAYGYLNSGGSTGSCGSCSADYSIQADGRIRASEFNAISDQRIKTVVGHTSPKQLLDLVNRLKVTKYEYIDKIENGSESKEGFIAQEVELVLPTAIKTTQDFIPSVYSLPIYFSFDGQSRGLTINCGKEHGLIEGDEVKLIIESGPRTAFVTSANATSFTVGEWDTQPKSLFVYGKRIDDFRAVDYDQVFSVGIGAIQQLSKENDQLRIEVETLKSQLFDLNALKAEVDKIKAMLNVDALGANVK